LQDGTSRLETNPTTTTLDKKKLMPLLDELKTMLDQGNAKASTLLEKIVTVAGASLVEPLATIEKQIDDYEFDEAGETLSSLINTLEE
jgi:hypothetical protein